MGEDYMEFSNGPDQIIPCNNRITWAPAGTVKLRLDGYLERTTLSVTESMVDKDDVEGSGEDNEVPIEIQRETHKDLLRSVISTAKEAEKSVEATIDSISQGPDLSEGISFLDLKNGLLHDYNMNLIYLMLKKTTG